MIINNFNNSINPFDGKGCIKVAIADPETRKRIATIIGHENKGMINFFTELISNNKNWIIEDLTI